MFIGPTLVRQSLSLARYYNVRFRAASGAGWAGESGCVFGFYHSPCRWHPLFFPPPRQRHYIPGAGHCWMYFILFDIVGGEVCCLNGCRPVFARHTSMLESGAETNRPLPHHSLPSPLGEGPGWGYRITVSFLIAWPVAEVTTTV